MSGQRPRKVVVLLDCAGRGGEVESRSGGFECLLALRVFDLVSCGRQGGSQSWSSARWAPVLVRGLVDAGFFIIVGASRVYSFPSRRGFFSMTVVGDQLGWWSGSPWLCLCGWHPLVVSDMSSARVGLVQLCWCLGGFGSVCIGFHPVSSN
jgi:hypothetical protein